MPTGQILAPTIHGRAPNLGGVLFRYKEFYFDRQAVKEAIRESGQDPKLLRQAALKIRSQARRSMRITKHKHAAPGQPPRARPGRKQNLRSIEAFWHPGMKMGLVGSAIFPGTRARIQFVPEVHEFGGQIALLQPPRLKIHRRKRQRGGRPKATRKQLKSFRKKMEEQAFFKKLHPGQDPNKRVYQVFHYPPRPYMWPATLKVVHQLPQTWKGALRFHSVQQFDRRFGTASGGFDNVNQGFEFIRTAA